MSLAGVEPCWDDVDLAAHDEDEGGVKLNLRRSLKATTLGDIIDSGLVMERGELDESVLGDHMMTWVTQESNATIVRYFPMLTPERSSACQLNRNERDASPPMCSSTVAQR